MIATATEPTVQERFDKLAAQWKRNRGAASTIPRLCNHPAYLEIISLGSPALPIILKELEKDTDHWFVALHEISGENPVPTEKRGDVDSMKSAWLEWGQAKGLL